MSLNSTFLAATSLLIAVGVVGPAAADLHTVRKGAGSGSVSRDGKISAQVRFAGRAADESSAGRLEPRDSGGTEWKPPGCWYAPRYTSNEFRAHREELATEAARDPAAARSRPQIEERNRRHESENYHAGEKGRYWSAVRNPKASYEEQWACDREPFWVAAGEQSGVRRAVSPRVLAALAYQEVKVPATRVSTAPPVAAKVNLPTWVWLDRGRFRPVSVTATVDLPGLRFSSTTTATPVALTLDPGTPDARLRPAGGRCRLGPGGTVGRPYGAGGAELLPPCGVTYLRPSGEGAFPLRATVVWQVSWKGSDGSGGRLPDGEYGSVRPVVVEEAQSLNR